MLLTAALYGSTTHLLHAQTATSTSVSQQIQHLTESMASAQAALDQSRRQLNEMREQLSALEHQLAAGGSSSIPPTSASPSTTPPDTAQAIADIRERQAIQQSQIATHEQTKVESASKYPVKVTGLLLLNGFVNTRQVDLAATPTLALPGPGSTGASVRQTILGFEARGPHLFGGHSYADLNVDFDGSPSAGSTKNYSGYYPDNATLLRLRTLHAGLEWTHTTAWFALDHPILTPSTPTSLTAVAEPALAWSGDLWTWNPQAGVTQDVVVRSSTYLRLEGALLDVGDAPLSLVASPIATTGTLASTAEQSRWPGVEARIALLGSKKDEGNHLGFGGYFSPHLNPYGRRYNSWAGTLDGRLLFPASIELTASFYRGTALGGLGGGAYKDIAARLDSDTGIYYSRPLDDVGGWAQLKKTINERLEFNAAFGLDNVFAQELRPYLVPAGSAYQNLARNRTFTGNFIYSPSSYLLFSLEYRHLESSPVVGQPSSSNIVGLGAGYRF